MAGFADLPADVQALQSDVSGALIGTVLGVTQTQNDQRTPLIAQSAIVSCYQHAPGAPLEILRGKRNSLGRVDSWNAAKRDKSN